MPGPGAGDTRFYTPSGEAHQQARALDKDREAHARRQRRLEEKVFESTTLGLERPLLRPRTGTPLREPQFAAAISHGRNSSGGPIVLPPATFTDAELETF